MPNHDLSKWQDTYESAPEEREQSSERTEVPDGNYQARVARVELRESGSGNLMLEWELDILGPRCQGRKLWRNNMLASAENIKYLKADLYLCGVRPGELNELNNERTLRPLIGVTLEITKKTKGEYSNVYFNRRIQLATPDARPASQSAVTDDDVPF